MAECNRGCGLRQRRQVVWQTYEHHSINKCWVSNEVAKAAACEVESLAHRAGDNQLRRELSQQRCRRWLLSELGVGLIDNDDARRGFNNAAQDSECGQVASRVVRSRDEDDVGTVLGNCRERTIHVDVEGLRVAVDADELRLRAGRENRVHRVAGDKPHRAAPRPAECLQQLLENLIGAVGGPHLVDSDVHTGLAGDIVGKCGAQRYCVTVRVAVEVRGDLLHFRDQVSDEVIGWRIRVFVGVQPNIDVELRGTVGFFAAQFVAQWQICQRQPGYRRLWLVLRLVAH